MTTYQAFVKAHIAQMPGASPKERMRQVAAKWREVPASQKTSVAQHHVKHVTAKVIHGKGFFGDFVKGVSSILSHVPGPIGTVAGLVHTGAKLFGGTIKGRGMTKTQITSVARQMHGGRIFTTGREAFMEGERMAKAYHL